MRKERCVCFVAIITVGLAAVANARPGAEASKTGSAILFADDHSRERFERYRAFLEKDAAKFASELETIERLERSDVQYVVSVVRRYDGNIEGEISTDGERVIVCVTDVGGPAAEVASLNSRFAHEFEHARQFDAGEFALARDPATGRWGSHYTTYDIGDEVAAWKAQLAASAPPDYWRRAEGKWFPTLLQLFSLEKTDAARAHVLATHGYGKVNPIFNSNVRFAASAGYLAGQVVRPGQAEGLAMFGRVYAVDPDVPIVVSQVATPSVD